VLKYILLPKGCPAEAESPEPRFVCHSERSEETSLTKRGEDLKPGGDLLPKNRQTMIAPNLHFIYSQRQVHPQN
jgi:hypothetical protein